MKSSLPIRCFGGVLLPLLVSAGTYAPLTNFGLNPTNVGINLYLPSTLAANPPLVVVPHWCHGSADDAYRYSAFTPLADTYGFPVIYPDSPNTADKCWDVSSRQTLTHNGGGDSLGIVSAVRYVAAKYNVDARRIFAQGTSSGAMMTNVLLGSYPDIFAAGSAWAGVAFGCFAGNGFAVWSDACATGKVVKTGAEWKKVVEDAYPGYNGWRPKLQIFHGSVDNVLYPQNFNESIKEWTAVLGLPASPSKAEPNTPLANWTRYSFGDGTRFTATLAAGVDHNIQTQAEEVYAWFDLRCTGAAGRRCFGRPDGGAVVSSSSVAASSSSRVPTTATSGYVGTVREWGQCGGENYTGPTYCLPGLICVVLNQYFSQCHYPTVRG